MEYTYNATFAVFSFCYKNVSAFTNYLISYEKGTESFTQSSKSTHDYSNEFVVAEARAVNDIALEFIQSIPGVTTVFSFLQENLVNPFVFLSLIFFFLFLIIGGYNIFKSTQTFRLLNVLLSVAEQEFATPKALLLLFSCVLCLILSSVFPIFFGCDLNIAKLFYLTSLGLILFLVLAIPLNLIYNWGVYFPIYIKGQSIKKNVFFELLTDYIHILSFFLRINIQLIRLVIITCVFYMYNNLYVEFIYPTLNSQYDVNGLLGYIYAGALFILKLTANILYEIGHLWIIVGMQSGAFAMIVFIITQFLYSVYLVRRLLPFFKNLKQKKN